MNSCLEYQQLLLEHLYGLLEEDERQALESHLAGCAACQSAYARACRLQHWLRLAACWPFEDVRFEPPAPAELTEPRSPQSLSRRPDWVRERLPLWVLATSLLLALGLVVWLSGMLGDIPSHWAPRDLARAERQDDAARRLASEGASAVGDRSAIATRGESLQRESPLLPSREKQRQELTRCEPESPKRDSGEALRRSASPSAAAAAASGQGTGFASPTAPADAVAPGRRQTPLLQERLQSDRAASESQADTGWANRPAEATKLERVAARSATDESTTPLPELFFAVLVVANPTDSSVAEVEIRDLPLNTLAQGRALEQRLARANTGNDPVMLVSPVPARNTVPAGQPQVTQSLVPAQPGGVPPNAAQNFAANNWQQALSNRVPLESLGRLQRWTVRLPKEASHAAPVAEIEVPVDSGNLSAWVDRVRIPVRLAPYLAAIAWQQRSRPEELLLQVIPVDSQQLQPTDLITGLNATLVDEDGRPLGNRLALTWRRYAIPPIAGRPTNASSLVVYETRFRLPSAAANAFWLHLSDDRGLLTPMQLRCRANRGLNKPGGGQGKAPDRRLSAPLASAPRSPSGLDISSPLQQCGNDGKPGCRADPVPGSDADLELDAMLSLAESLACCDPAQAVALARARRHCSPAQTSFTERLRDYARRQCSEAARPAFTGRPAVGELALIPETVSRTAHDQVGQLVAQWVNPPQRRERWLGILTLAGGIVLAGLSTACGIFGTICGSRRHLCWWRRLLMALLVLTTVWLAWSAAQANSGYIRPRTHTIHPAGLSHTTLAGRELRSAATPATTH